MTRITAPVLKTGTKGEWLRANVTTRFNRVLAGFENKKAVFLKDAAVNPIQAMEMHGRGLAAEQRQHQLLTDLAGHLNQIETEEVEPALRRQLRSLEDGILGIYVWRSNSTCPMSNVMSQETAKGDCAMVAYLRWLLNEKF